MKKNELSNTQDGRLTALFDKVSAIIEQSRNLVYATANFAEVKARYEVGRYIFEDEQQGERAAYGKDLLRQLSKKLMEKFGDDWTYDDLFDCEAEIYDDEFASLGACVLEPFDCGRVWDDVYAFQDKEGINVFIARKEYGAYQVCVNEDELSLDEIEIVKKFFDELVDKYGLRVVGNRNAN